MKKIMCSTHYKKVILLFFAIFGFMIMILNNQNPIYALQNDHTVLIPIKQVLDTNDKDNSVEFTYVLKAEKSGSPMPANSEGKEYKWIMRNDSHVNLTINVNQEGSFNYKIYQETKDINSYVIDHHIYSLCIKANNDNNDLITITTVTNENGEKVENVTFKNQFKSFDTDTQNKELCMLKNKIKTGDSYLTGSYMCMFLVSSVILILFIIKFSNKKKGDVK